MEKLVQALEGIASCATQCPCCEMHRRLANKALGYSMPVTFTLVMLPQPNNAKAEALVTAIAAHIDGVKTPD